MDLTSNKIKKILREIIILSSIAFVSFCVSCYFYNLNNKETIKCGIVESKNDYTTSGSKNGKLYMYLNMKYDNGEFESVSVTPTIYHKYQKNDRTCFPYKNDKFYFYSILGEAFFIIIILCIFGVSLIWIFN